MQTGENEQALRKISDMSRFIAITLLMLHFYFYCYGAFESWGLTVPFTDRLLHHIGNTGLFQKFNYSKYWALLFLMISSMGIKGKKDDKLSFKPAIAYLVTGFILYFFSNILWNASHDSHGTSILYMAITSSGFLLIISGATLLTRVIRSKLKSDIFNTDQETITTTKTFSLGLDCP